MAHEASPVMDITVRPMSTIRSMSAATATHSKGIFAEASTIGINASELPDTAVALIVTLIVVWCLILLYLGISAAVRHHRKKAAAQAAADK